LPSMASSLRKHGMSAMGGKQTLTQAADMQCIGTCHISRARPNLLRWLLLT
jgi:hypothetical protein